MSKKRLTREESKQETRTKLVQVATETFIKKGFHGASVDKIAEEAGFSKGAVYSNFGSKEDLFLAVFSEQQKDDIQTLTDIAKQHVSLDDYIHALDQNHQRGRGTNNVWGLLKLEFLLYAMREPSAREKLAPILHATRKQSQEILEHFFHSQANKSPISIEKLTFLLLALDIGIGILHYADESSVPDGIFADGLKQLLKNE